MKKTSIVVDTANDMSIVSNGVTGTQFLYDFRKKTVMQYVSKQFRSSNTTIEQYVESMKSIKRVVSNMVQQKTFSINSPPTDALAMHLDVIKTLQPEMGSFGQIKMTAVYSIFLNLMQEITKISKGGLRNIIVAKMKSRKFVIRGGIMNVVSVFRGLYTLVTKTTGNIQSRILMSNKFDMKSLFLSECGTEALAIIVNQLGAGNFQLAQLTNYPIIMYKVVKEFSGGMYSGLKGIENFVYHTIAFLNKQSSLESFIDLLIQVGSQYKPIRSEQIINKINFIVGILNKNRSIQTQQILVNFQRYISGSLTIGRVNIASLVQKFMIGGQLKISSFVELLNTMQIDVMKAISTLFVRLSFFTLTDQGNFLISKLLPILKQFIDVNSRKRIINQIGHETNINGLMMQVKEQNVETIVQQIPAIKQIFQSVEMGLQNVQINKQAWFKSIVQSGALEKVISWVKFGGGVKGGREPVGCIHDIGLWAIDQTHGCKCFD